MRRSQIETDLLKNACDRLVNWRQDTIMRCEVVDLDYQIQISIIYTCLVGELVQLTSMLKMTEADFSILMQDALTKFKRMDLKNKSVEDENRA